VEYDDREPWDVIEWALTTFSQRRIAVCTSFQVDGMAILDMAWRVDPSVRVFTVDTGRMPQETYDLIQAVRDRYGMEIELHHPDTQEVAKMVNQHGQDLFLTSVPLRLTCCDVRKVRPLVRVLGELDGWITGLRRDQWATRSNIRKIEIDHDHGGLIKVNPLADWTEEEVWEYLQANEVPHNALYDKGYKTIGCAPCTRAVEPGAEQRSGRWWWEKAPPRSAGCTARWRRAASSMS